MVGKSKLPLKEKKESMEILKRTFPSSELVSWQLAQNFCMLNRTYVKKKKRTCAMRLWNAIIEQISYGIENNKPGGGGGGYSDVVWTGVRG